MFNFYAGRAHISTDICRIYEFFNKSPIEVPTFGQILLTCRTQMGFATIAKSDPQHPAHPQNPGLGQIPYSHNWFRFFAWSLLPSEQTLQCEVIGHTKSNYVKWKDYDEQGILIQYSDSHQYLHKFADIVMIIRFEGCVFCIR